jgi:predicted nucleotide-binding protein (sugar kinase/HSP70/actin superfamily)
MEVGKLIMNVKFKKATMTLSVKPFGCMPSSGVSDGVQSMVTERFPEAIYCPIETNGDGAVNVYSRVQMMLFKARLAAKAEYEKTLESAGLTSEQLKAKLQKSWWKRSALYYPKHGSVAAMSSNVVEEVTGVAAAAH